MTTPTTEQPRSPQHATPLAALRIPDASEIANFRSTLQRPGHKRDFAVATLIAYARSEGLCGYDPSNYEAFDGTPTSVIKGVVSSTTKELIEAGILVKGISPFDTFLGLFPSQAFILAIITDLSIFTFLSQPETLHLKKLSTASTDSSQAEIEKRWLLKIASAFLYVPHGTSLQVSQLSKLLPEFEGREKRVSSVLAQLHERELITHMSGDGASEIFLTSELPDLLEDKPLAEQLKDPHRKPELFPFIVKHNQEIEERIAFSSAPSPKIPSSEPVNRAVKAVSPALKQALAAATTTPLDTGGNSAGREARAAILAAVSTAPIAPTTAKLLASLSHLSIQEPALKYHIKLLCKDGHLRQEGRGRKAVFVLDQRARVK